MNTKTPPNGIDYAGRGFKYPSEDEPFVRRLGAAALVHWADIPQEVRDRILAEAGQVWDREYHIPQIARKLEVFVKRHIGRR
ncbi:MAG: hypothetical protein KGJ78_10910 [Alphaproteobacteria bacterium]|nr:hypothetical protein [Alphaproteobacteria bacterium]